MTAVDRRMPTRLGLCTLALLDRPIEAVADLARAAGYDGLEVTGRPEHVGPDDVPAAERAAAVLAARGLVCLAYGSYLGTRGRRQPEHAVADVLSAEVLGAPLLRVWAADDWPQEQVVDLLRRVSDAAACKGITVVVERHLGSYADTADRVQELLTRVARPNCLLNYQVLDALPASAAADQAQDARRLAPWTGYVHLKNYLPPAAPGEPLRPWASLAGGEIDCAALLRELLGRGYDGPLSVEFLSADTRPVEVKLADDVAFLRRLLASAALAD